MLKPVNKTATMLTSQVSKANEVMCDVCYFCDSPGDYCNSCDALDYCVLTDT